MSVRLSAGSLPVMPLVQGPNVVMQIFQKQDSWLGGMDEAIAILKLCADDWDALTVNALYDGDVLDGRDDDPRAARAARAERHPPDGEVIGLGRARGEDQARGRAATEARHLDARGLERGPRLRAERVRCGGIADARLEERAHDCQHPRIDRSEPSVVEVDALGRRVAGAHPTGSS